MISCDVMCGVQCSKFQVLPKISIRAVGQRLTWRKWLSPRGKSSVCMECFTRSLYGLVNDHFHFNACISIIMLSHCWSTTYGFISRSTVTHFFFFLQLDTVVNYPFPSLWLLPTIHSPPWGCCIARRYWITLLSPRRLRPQKSAKFTSTRARLWLTALLRTWIGSKS